MRADHVAVIHLVDVVASENQDIFRIGFLDAVNVLIDGVGGALVPVFVDALLRRQHLDVFTKFAAEETPPRHDVPIQAPGLVLRQHQHTAQVAVNAVGKGEIDDPVEAAKGHRRFGAIAGEWIEPSALAAGQN